MATFLFKTEPTEYSFADLLRDKRTVWSGISNNAALAHLRSAKRGDEVLVYHTGEERCLVGLARIVKAPYEDPKQPGTNGKGEPKFAVVDIEAVRPATEPIELSQIKKDPRFAAFALVRQPRLSVMPVPPAMDAALRTMAGL